MITTESQSVAYLTIARNGTHELVLDAPLAKGGGAQGFGPHELLEAAIAACLNMAVRMHAAAHNLPLTSVSTAVRLVRPDNSTTRFEYSLHLIGDLTESQRAALLDAAATCPVRSTLSRTLQFQHVPAEAALQ